MRRLIASLILAVVTCGAMISAGCVPSASGDIESDVVIIDYSAGFTGQAASGLLNLEVDLEIENHSDTLFNTSPTHFAVQVGEYFYKPRGGHLPAIDLRRGETAVGTLYFQVPAAAATTRVGFALAYSGPATLRIEWHGYTAQRDVEPSQPVVLITYYGNPDGEFMWDSTTSKLYLLVDVVIENKGYESFNTNPAFFSLIVGNIFGQPDPEPPIAFDGELSDDRDEAFTDLRSYDLQNGGRLTGTIAFEVPPRILAATEGYSLEYSGLRAYNIQWYRQLPNR